MPFGKVRATPTNVPTMSAMVQAPSARQRVQPKPLAIQSRYRPAPSGVGSNSKDIATLPLTRTRWMTRSRADTRSGWSIGARHVVGHWPLALSLGALINSLSFSDCGKFRLMFLGGIGVSNHLV